MITASIVLYKNSVAECHAVLNCLLDSPVERIFLIDHSSDDSLSVLREYSPRIEYIPHENSGYGSGHNVAMRKALEINPSGYHIVLNSDIIFPRGTIQKLAAFMDKHPHAGLCMPDVRNPDGTRQYLCKYLPTPFDLFGKRFLPSIFTRRACAKLMMMDADYSKVLSVPWLSGCFMFLRQEAIGAVHGFDESFFMYGEDIDFSRRIGQKYDTLYCPVAQITHVHAASSYHSLKMLLIHIRNVSHYFNKWGWFLDHDRDRINAAAFEFNNR